MIRFFIYGTFFSFSTFCMGQDLEINIIMPGSEDKHNTKINLKSQKLNTKILSSELLKFKKKKQLKKVIVKQNYNWNNWKKTKKITPPEATNAPELLTVDHKKYWLFAQLIGDHKNGYHAWFSDNMKSWSYKGIITTHKSKWVTSVEFLNGEFYIYYDFPNDEDPHLIIDSNLDDNKIERNIGKVFDDPSHGSDIAIFRDTDEKFHMIYEDWTPINPRNHAWDSPLAGHTDSPDGILNFSYNEYIAPIDCRTNPTGRILNYSPHHTQLDLNKNLGLYTYEEHEGNMDAFGDFSIIKVGEIYYLFSDYHPKEKNKSMRIARWRSNDIYKPFIWDGEIGEDIHPDPSIIFAENMFYLIVQEGNYDYMSTGPWLDGVEVRLGLDINNDNDVDYWTKFRKIKESYSLKKGFTKVIDVIDAEISFDSIYLYGFKIEFRLNEKNGCYPEISHLNIILE